MSSVPTGKTARDWLEQIANSPSRENSGFHHKAIVGAKWGLGRIAALEADVKRRRYAYQDVLESWQESRNRTKEAEVQVAVLVEGYAKYGKLNHIRKPVTEDCDYGPDNCQQGLSELDCRCGLADFNSILANLPAAAKELLEKAKAWDSFSETMQRYFAIEPNKRKGMEEFLAERDRLAEELEVQTLNAKGYESQLDAAEDSGRSLFEQIKGLRKAWEELLRRAKDGAALAKFDKEHDRSPQTAIGKSIVWNTIIVEAVAALAAQEPEASGEEPTP